ncbi:MAG: oligosaccharide flippase family protein [Bdellovibrionales bacterium]|nr:oligosaccharide flippase family protein [Bdellovibrionales bacterium]
MILVFLTRKVFLPYVTHFTSDETQSLQPDWPNNSGAFVGIVAIPLLIQNIGMERFGLLTIIWAIIGYFSLFDFGLSRVITYRVSEMHRVQDLSDLPSFFWSSLRLIFIFTLVGSALLAISSKFGFAFSGKISGDLLPEALDCLLVMALALPSITLTAGFKGLLEAEHRFFDLNVLQVIQGTLNFLIPLWISYYRPSLSWIVVALALLRYLFLILHGWIAIKQQPKLRNVSLLPLKQSVPIIRAGGWYSVSNIVGPFMFYFDRFSREPFSSRANSVLYHSIGAGKPTLGHTFSPFEDLVSYLHSKKNRR